MKRFRPSLRRVSSFAAAAFAGAAATLFIATPAFAHHTLTTGVSVCNPAGGWTVNWTVNSSVNKERYKILSATAKDGVTDAAIAAPFTGELASPTGFKPIAQSFTGSQSFSNSVSSVWLSVAAHWENNDGSGGQDQSSTPEQHATVVEKPTCDSVPVVTFKDNCDGTVTVTLDNQQGSQPATFNVNGTDHQVNGGQKKDVNVPGNAQVVVQIPGDDDATHTWRQPAGCTTPTPSATTPVTGASVTGTIGIGAGLVVGGAVLIGLVFMMRRRRTVAGN